MRMGVVYPDADGMGTVIVPTCAVLVAKGPNAEGGKMFIDYLLRPETEQTLAESDAAQMPVRPGVTIPSHVVPLEKLKPMQVDYGLLAAKLEELCRPARGYLKEWVDRNSR